MKSRLRPIGIALKMLALAGLWAALLVPGRTPSALAPDHALNTFSLSHWNSSPYEAKDAGRNCVR